MKLLYLANARIPTEKAHGLQIMQNCEALADAGAEVTLWAARRVNTPEFRAVTDPWTYYGVKANFVLRRVPCLDLQPWASEVTLLRRAAFFLQYVTYLLALLFWLIPARFDVYYTRDLPAALLLSLLKPRRRIAYEPHRLSGSGIGRRLQALAVRRAGQVFPITSRMADDLIQRGADPARVQVAHDGIRRARFEHLPTQADARQAVGWPEQTFIVGYVGRLHTMSMDKGVGTLIRALEQVEGASLALVGGPDDMAESLRQQWVAAGLSPARFLYAGQVMPDSVPLYLSAFDVCTMPLPFTPHYAYAASPLKLFEYMACGRPLVASDLPGWSDVVRDGESALLVPPGEVDSLAEALRRLRDDPNLRARLAACARQIVFERYTWDARARKILRAFGDPARQETAVPTGIDAER